MRAIFPSAFLALAVASLAGYVLAVVVLFEQFGSWVIQPWVVWLGAGIAGIVGFWASARAVRTSNMSTIATGVTIFVILLSVVAVDFIHVKWTRWNETKATRLADSLGAEAAALTPMSLHPPSSSPTDRNFRIHEPGFSRSGDHYGAFVTPAMLKSPSLMASVLKSKSVDIQIDAQGFRNSIDLAETQLVALGDSLTFGWGVGQDASWPALANTMWKEKFYNLGAVDGSPRHQYETLKHLLEENSPQFKPSRVVWVLYEGNDLEDDYEPYNREVRSAYQPAVANRIGAALISMPARLKRKSIITRYRLREFTIGSPPPRVQEIDGVKVPYFIYRSSQFGLRLFYPEYVRRALLPELYVNSHPHNESAREIFAAMADLAQQYQFKVTVTVVPTAARTHGPQYADFPRLSDSPHVIDFFSDLSLAQGFDTIDLLTVFEREGRNQLLYFTDDDHLNAAGNQLLAKTIVSSLRQQ